LYSDDDELNPDTSRSHKAPFTSPFDAANDEEEYITSRSVDIVAAGINAAHINRRSDV
jgi:hypothetical protein